MKPINICAPVQRILCSEIRTDNNIHSITYIYNIHYIPNQFICDHTQTTQTFNKIEHYEKFMISMQRTHISI